MRLNNNVGGVYVIASTPFHSDGRIDERSLDRMVSSFLEFGVTGITVLGQMGEAPKLDHAEALKIAGRLIQRATVPVIVGVSAPGFAAMRSLTRAVMDTGAAGVMIAPPSSLKTDDQIVTYYSEVAEVIGGDVPFVIQDYPLTFNVTMSPDVIRRIVQGNPSCVMLKHEDWPGLEKITTLRGFEADGSMRHISILCGNSGLFLDFETERGIDGAMTGYCFPDMLVDMVHLAMSGNRDAAHDLFDLHLPLIRYEQQPGLGLAVRKYVLMRRGILESDTQRKPAMTLSSRAKAEVDYLLSRIAQSDKRACLEPALVSASREAASHKSAV
jgi:4-hydroxy-tetrahydrodipicolinate synthase